MQAGISSSWATIFSAFALRIFHLLKPKKEALPQRPANGPKLLDATKDDISELIEEAGLWLDEFMREYIVYSYRVELIGRLRRSRLCEEPRTQIYRRWGDCKPQLEHLRERREALPYNSQLLAISRCAEMLTPEMELLAKNQYGSSVDDLIHEFHLILHELEENVMSPVAPTLYLLDADNELYRLSEQIRKTETAVIYYEHEAVNPE